MSERVVNQVDTLIMGGGLAGLTLAIQLKKKHPELTLAVIEKSQFPVPLASHKVGEATVELATYYFSEMLGLTEHLETAQLPKLGLRFFFPANPDNVSSMDNFIEFGTKTFPPTPSFQLDRGVLENHLYQVCLDIGIRVYQNTRVRSLEIGEDDTQHQVSVIDNQSKVKMDFQCTWLVDAMSRAFMLKRKLGLMKSHSHKASSAWFRINHPIDVNNFSDSEQWHKDHQGENSRWYSTNHFMGEGFWIWFIPLVSGSTSIGIVADERFHSLSNFNNIDKAMAWLWRYQPKCAAEIEPHLDKLQDFRSMPNFTHSSEKVYSKDRWFLTGEAGVFLDPFYSPGSDYIAMSNTFITNIISADIAGHDPAPIARRLNRLYMGLFESTSILYENKYQLFGKPTIMIVKYIWDTALYWGLNAFLFTQGKFEQTEELQRYYISVSDLESLNENMQQLLLDWSEYPQDDCVPSYINVSNRRFDFFIDMNRVLLKPHNDAEFAAQLAENAQKMRTLYADIVAYVAEKTPELANKYPATTMARTAHDSPIVYMMQQIRGEIDLEMLDDEMDKMMEEAKPTMAAMTEEPA